MTPTRGRHRFAYLRYPSGSPSRSPSRRAAPFADCNESDVVDRRTGTLHGVARYAVDPDNAGRLWALSRELLAQAC